MAKEKKHVKKTTAGSMSPGLLHKVRVIGAHLGIGNAVVLDRYAGPAIDKVYRRLESRRHVELGEAGA